MYTHRVLSPGKEVERTTIRDQHGLIPTVQRTQFSGLKSMEGHRYGKPSREGVMRIRTGTRTKPVTLFSFKLFSLNFLHTYKGKRENVSTQGKEPEHSSGAPVWTRSDDLLIRTGHVCLTQ